MCTCTNELNYYYIGQTCPQGTIRLQGGGSTTYGRVEICNGHTWGVVCDDFWDNVDAAVVCRQLGSPTAGKIAYALFLASSRSLNQLNTFLGI